MLDRFAVGRFTPRNIEIGTRNEHPKDAYPSESEKQTLDKDADKNANCHH
jgi:hypothetical protein